ncbi:gene transfer agent family protein [Aliihoeflea sp. 40Bstr573]|uniref:gene transfer agent family protein n=1 Tax=Aliihoeflea sp. 40Bstr573 TaxID=2696467 RepID=UPI0020949225|nr:gene transfer agent family protein [Aliihoeflea sp. 40Bstr573]MCO6386239.1 gene transfer agent family protein [Aliihoeflea sp. 40Bstr573]
MNRHGAIDLTWAGGDHTFRLGMDQIEELEATTEMSIFLLHAAMASEIPMARLKHYSETIRLGLLGGGMKPIEARVLTKRYVDERPLTESVALAQAILRASLERVHSKELEDDLGEQEAASTSASTSPQSMQMPA